MGPFRNPQLTLAYSKRIRKLPVHKLCGCGNTIVCSGIKSGYAKKRLIPGGPDLPLTSKNTHTHTLKQQLADQSSLLSLRYQDLSFLGDMGISVFYAFGIWLPLDGFVFSLPILSQERIRKPTKCSLLAYSASLLQAPTAKETPVCPILKCSFIWNIVGCERVNSFLMLF